MTSATSARRLHVFTSAAVNYLPKVRALLRSVRRFHPEAMIHFALADERPPWLTAEGEPFDAIVEMSELGIANWRAWAFTHDIVELSTAIKPFVLRKLLARDDCGAVLYFDPDMVLFSRVDDILHALEGANIALTPHQTRPESTPEAVIDNEIGSLKFGIFNLGFLGVAATPEGRRFAEWWAQRCHDFCRAEVHNGLFTDQKWINHVPVFFDGVAIIKSSRHNVATWNLTTRELAGDLLTGLTVDGEPLGFYHFTGFDSGAHRIMAVKNASGNDTVQSMIAWYQRETAPARDDPVADWPWAFGRFADGSRIERQHRWIYRENRDLQAAFPDPFAGTAGGLTFRQWTETEGRVRFPQLFPRDGNVAAPAPRGAAGGMTRATLLRLALLMLAPRGGKLLRARVVATLRNEGIGGIVRRLRRPAEGRAA